MSGELLARLIEAGTPAALVAEVAMELARAQAIQEVAEQRKAKDRERKRPRNSAESVESAEIQESPSLEVSPQTPLPNPTRSSPLNPPIFEEKRRAIASCLRKAFPPPDGVTDEQWEAFRKQRRKALNERSYALLVSKITKLASQGHRAGDLIDLAIERGWETVFEPREFGGGKIVPASSTAKLGPAEQIENLKKSIELYTRMGRHDDIRECRRKIAALEGRPPPDVAGLIRQATRAA
jgi:hypothetical protein